ncbi:MAG: DUF1361 domain-containing protein [Bacteroidota bacterium]
MSLKISGTSKMLLASIAFSMSLLLVRFLYSNNTIEYSFYGWNTFLAAIPYLVSTQLIKLRKMKITTFIFIGVWLLFFPNAPYMITDLFHYEERPGVPFWYDLLLVISAAWNGLILGMISLMNVEIFLSRHFKKVWVVVSVFISLLLCGYGVFIGRFLRFNSWNIVTDFRDLAYSSAHHVLQPQHYPKLWVFTILFSVLLTIIYFTLKNLPRIPEHKED